VAKIQRMMMRTFGGLNVGVYRASGWAAAFGATLTPTAASTGQNFRGPQDPAVICPASGPNTPTHPVLCDDRRTATAQAASSPYADPDGGVIAGVCSAPR
jgi:hypothetical protein